MSLITSLLLLANLPTVIVAVITLLVVWVVKAWYWDIYHSDLPPVPEIPIPFLGHIYAFRKDPRQTFSRWRKTGGDVLSFYVGGRPIVVFSGYDTLKEAFVKHADQFSDRPKTFITELFHDFHKGVVSSNGANWKEERTVAIQILRSFGMGKNVMADKIQQEVNNYLDHLGRFNGEANNIRTMTNVYVANVITSIIVGQRFEVDDPFFLDFLGAINEQLVLLGKSQFIAAYSWLRHLPGDPFYIKRVVKNFNEKIQAFASGFVDRQNKLSSEGDFSSYITEYNKELEKRTQQNVPTYLSERNLKRTIQNLFTAGSETTSTTLMWYMVLLMRNPEVQKRVYENIVDVVGTERVPTLQDKPQLKYLQATIMEAQRFGSTVPFSAPHACSETVKFRGYTILKGTTVFPNLDSVLMDEKIWGDPQNFRPERFLDNDGNLVHREELIPFSLGRRVCLGESLAKMELFMFTSCLSQRFELRPEQDGCPPSQDYVFGQTLAPKPFKVRFIERKAAN